MFPKRLYQYTVNKLFWTKCACTQCTYMSVCTCSTTLQDSVGKIRGSIGKKNDHLTFPLAPRNLSDNFVPTIFHRFSFNRSKFILNPYSDCVSCLLNRGTSHSHSQIRIELPCHFRFQICSFLYHVLCFWNSEISRLLFGYWEKEKRRKMKTCLNYGQNCRNIGFRVSLQNQAPVVEI